ncbi:Os08g0513650 [Oryza sativa Japonica Group]|uniref:Os08g0513650 protein n=1 Tax=Oryza sativa subsp. japonica TaxID=39947 RepID=A0A0P0XHX2_ORYSJ|nr:Os08g0513650 [Oryza sativa Japonica Group]
MGNRLLDAVGHWSIEFEVLDSMVASTPKCGWQAENILHNSKDEKDLKQLSKNMWETLQEHVRVEDKVAPIRTGLLAIGHPCPID